MGGNADFMDNRGHLIFQRRCVLLRCGGLSENTVHPVQQSVRLTGLRQKIAGTKRHRLAHHLIGAEGGEHNHLRLVFFLTFELSQNPQAIQSRQDHIHDQ